MKKINAGICFVCLHVLLLSIMLAANSNARTDEIEFGGKKYNIRNKPARYKCELETLASGEEEKRLLSTLYPSYRAAMDAAGKFAAEDKGKQLRPIPSAAMFLSAANTLIEDFVSSAEMIINNGLPEQNLPSQLEFYHRLYAKMDIDRLVRPEKMQPVFELAQTYIGTALILGSPEEVSIPDSIADDVAERLRIFRTDPVFSVPYDFHNRRRELLSTYFRDSFLEFPNGNSHLCIDDDDELRIALVICNLIHFDLKLREDYIRLYALIQALNFMPRAFNYFDFAPIIDSQPEGYYLNADNINKFRKEFKNTARWDELKKQCAVEYPDTWESKIGFILLPRIRCADTILFEAASDRSLEETVSMIKEGKLSVPSNTDKWLIRNDDTKIIEMGVMSDIASARAALCSPERLPEFPRKVVWDKKYLETMSGFASGRLAGKEIISGIQARQSGSEKRAKDVTATPNFSVEPVPAVYIRIARTLRNLRDVAKKICAPEIWRNYSLITDDNTQPEVSPYAKVEHYMYVAYGLHLVSCSELGMHHSIDGAELDSQEKTLAEEAARKWLLDNNSDYLTFADVRRAVPVSRGESNISYNAVRGVRLAVVKMSFSDLPVIEIPDAKEEKEKKQKLPSLGVNTAYYILPVEEWMEFSRPKSLPAPTRVLFRRLCEKNEDIDELRDALRKIIVPPANIMLFILIITVIISGALFAWLLWKNVLKQRLLNPVPDAKLACEDGENGGENASPDTEKQDSDITGEQGK